MHPVTLGVFHLQLSSDDALSCLEPTPTNDRQARNRFRIDCYSRNGRMTITWKSGLDEKARAKVVVDIMPTRKARHRGWGRLCVHGGADDYRAYYLFVISLPSTPSHSSCDRKAWGDDDTHYLSHTRYVKISSRYTG